MTQHQSAETDRSQNGLRDIPYKLIFEIAQTISQLAAKTMLSERRPLMHQLANETEFVKKYGEEIFILLNCPDELRLDYVHAVRQMRSRNLTSQLKTMEKLFLALSWDDPDKGRPKITRYPSGEIQSVTPATPRRRL